MSSKQTVEVRSHTDRVAVCGGWTKQVRLDQAGGNETQLDTLTVNTSTSQRVLNRG